MRKESLKKLFSISLTGALTASTLLTGCGSAPKEEAKKQDSVVQESADGETAAADDTKGSGETIEIKLSTTWTQGSVVQEEIENLIAKFEEEHPGVVIEHDALSTADLRTKLTVQAASGDMPDVSWCPQISALRSTVPPARERARLPAAPPESWDTCMWTPEPSTARWAITCI